MCPIGLRVDVDTLRGTRIGVPRLVKLLARHRIRATFFFSVGPDNMGRHLWRLVRPIFLFKMFRTRAVSLYGWDIFLRGTLLPGPVIGKRCPAPIREAAKAGHEIGLHAWDHYRWQMMLERMDQSTINDEIRKGYELMKKIMGKAPVCFAAPAWKVTTEALYALEHFPFRFESDCRGHSLFRPMIEGHQFSHVQVPSTLPTYDELIGRECTPKTYNNYLLKMIQPDSINVLTIHAEAEGILCFSMFQDFLNKARQQHIAFHPLGELLCKVGNIEVSCVTRGAVAGREGWVACQSDSSSI